MMNESGLLTLFCRFLKLLISKISEQLNLGKSDSFAKEIIKCYRQYLLTLLFLLGLYNFLVVV
jgi:hypothetical protein